MALGIAIEMKIGQPNGADAGGRRRGQAAERDVYCWMNG